MLATQLIRFYQQLSITAALPAGVDILLPHQNKDVMTLTRAFFKKYYSDKKSRKVLIGINPGRLGAGITGINFTGPRQLTTHCSIQHPFGDSSELSAEFIYEVIEAYGGATAFYTNYFITAVSPLGFVKDGRNLNYYDDPSLQKALTPFIMDCLDKQFSFGIDNRKCLCIGGEKNFKFLSKFNDQRAGLNKRHFQTIVPLPHPRFIMQYRRKQKKEFIDLYLKNLL